MSKIVYMKKEDTFQGFRLEQESYDKVPEGKGDHKMSNNESMETLFKEIKLDLREREERTRREISEREERFEKQIEKFTQDASAREQRFIDDAKERELRITTSFQNLETKIDTKIQNLETKIDSHATHIETMKNQNFWGNVAIFGAMLAIVVALIIRIF